MTAVHTGSLCMVLFETINVRILTFLYLETSNKMEVIKKEKKGEGAFCLLAW